MLANAAKQCEAQISRLTNFTASKAIAFRLSMAVGKPRQAS